MKRWNCHGRWLWGELNTSCGPAWVWAPHRPLADDHSRISACAIAYRHRWGSPDEPTTPIEHVPVECPCQQILQRRIPLRGFLAPLNVKPQKTGTVYWICADSVSETWHSSSDLLLTNLIFLFRYRPCRYSSIQLC